MSDPPARSAVTLTADPMWRIRLRRELPRYLVSAMSIAGLAASARFALAPPRARLQAASLQTSRPPDRAAEGYASLFIRRYLTWDDGSGSPVAPGALESFLGSSEQAGEPVPPAAGEQHVEWAEVVQAREPTPGTHVYTVAAQTDAVGLLYLSVGVTRAASGHIALSDYPAFVGSPDTGPAVVRDHAREVADPALLTVVRRALRNYLADSPNELAADLTDGARVSLPTLGLALDVVERVDWASENRSVRAVVRAHDQRGAQYTLAYEMDVLRVGGRWEVSAVQMDPDA